MSCSITGLALFPVLKITSLHACCPVFENYRFTNFVLSFGYFRQGINPIPVPPAWSTTEVIFIISFNSQKFPLLWSNFFLQGMKSCYVAQVVPNFLGSSYPIISAYWVV
jgi:hypothetical protein